MTRIIIFASFLIIAFTQNSFAQIDTNDVYPLQKGNLWEYTNYIDIHYYQVIVGEETLPNGKTYKKRMGVDLIEGDTSYTYWRVEDEKVYIKGEYGDESICVDATLAEGSIWINHSSGGLFFGNKITLKRKYYDYIFNDSLTYYFIEEIQIDSSLNPPDTSVITDLYYTFTKGVGEIRTVNYIKLTGAIINGKEYGYVSVNVKDEQPFLNNYEIEISAYPNPFNGNCNVTFTIPKTQNIKLKLFNILGEEIYTLHSGELQKGEKHFNLNMPKEISSGIFFILLETEKRNYSKKILYLK